MGSHASVTITPPVNERAAMRFGDVPIGVRVRHGQFEYCRLANLSTALQHNAMNITTGQTAGIPDGLPVRIIDDVKPDGPAGVKWGETGSRGFHRAYWFKDRLCIDTGGACIDVLTGRLPTDIDSHSIVYPVPIIITPAFGPPASGGQS